MGKAEKYKIILMAILIGNSCFLTYIFHVVLKTGIVFTHFFYIPIILASIWWKRKGLFVAIFLAAFLIFSNIFFGGEKISLNDYARSFMFIVIASVVALLSEHISKAEREIKLAYAELNQIFNTAGHGMIVIDRDSKVLLANERFSILSGIKRDEAVGKQCFEVFPGPLCHTSDCPLTKIISGEERVECEVEKERKDGTRVPCIVTATPLRGPDGTLLGIVEDFKDITERKQTEKALQESENQYRTIFETTGAATMIIEEDSTIFMINKEFEKLFVCSKNEVEGKKSWFEFVAKDDLERIKGYHYLRRIDRNAAPSNYEFRGSDRHGNLKNLLMNVSVIPGTKKTVASVLDITELKRAEEDRVLLATAIEQAAEGITITDSDGTVQYVNPAFERISGYTREELIGQNHRILKSKKHDEAFYKAMWDKLSRGEVWTGHIINEKKDGTTYEVEAMISPIRDTSNTIISYVTIERDVTHEVEMETHLRQVQKMEAIGTLAGGIAHDFNNILGAIMGYTEMALSDVQEGTRTKRNLEQVLKAGYRGKDLVKQIITFSRKSEQERKPMRITPIVKEVLKFLRSSLPTTIEIRQNIKTDSGMILSDPTQIHQVLMNLCSNAEYAMRETGGVLEVSLIDVDINSSYAARHPDLKPGSYVRMTVSDTGHGMDRTVMERIFEPFFTTKRPGEGTGMGLSVVLGIVKNHGGIITVYSDPGEGSTFNVFLPRIDSIVKSEKEVSTQIPTGSERILFVDDEEDLVDMGQQMLERLGYKVTAKTSGIEVLEIFRAHPDDFDVVITDQTMPNMTGAELAEELMRIRPDIPIILCTGFSEVISEEKAQSKGIRGFLMKPITTQEMAGTIRRVLDRKK